MGLQGVKLPGFALDSPVFQDDVAGITASWKFNPNVKRYRRVDARLYNDNWSGNDASPANYLDNFDLFVLSVPVTFEGLKITPWGMAEPWAPIRC